MNLDLEIMQPESMKAYHLIKDFIRRRKLYTGGCKTFYTPHEWRYRKEPVLENPLLVLVYDGSDVKEIVYGRYAQTFKKFLAKHGFYLEQGHHWNCGIYKKDEQ
jgi:hypothetical protein